jgi:hypothetical protein
MPKTLLRDTKPIKNPNRTGKLALVNYTENDTFYPKDNVQVDTAKQTAYQPVGVRISEPISVAGPSPRTSLYLQKIPTRKRHYHHTPVDTLGNI